METAARPEKSPQQKGSLRLWFAKMATGVLFLAGVMFLSSGRLVWIEGWLFLAAMMVNVVAMTVAFLRRAPDLLVERSGLQPGVKWWDLPLASLMAQIPVAILILAGLNLRFGWQASLPLPVRAAGGILVVAGMGLLFTWAVLSNRFFSAVVRIQTDRGHTVETGGPYRYVRHPGSAAILLAYPGMALLLGFSWTLSLAGVAMVVTLIRTAREDRTLREELPGYEEYVSRVRYRLVPGIW